LYSWDNSFIVGAEAGQGSSPVGSYFNGLIDDVRIYNRALSAIEVDSLYHLSGWPGPAVASTSPSQNAIDVAMNSSITVTFNENIDGTTITSSNFIVRGSNTGLIAGSYSSGSNTGTFTPSAPFMAGELISVILTTGIEDADDVPLQKPYSWSFTVEVDDYSGTFAAKTDYDASDGAHHLYAADLDGDGDFDLITANAISDNISVLLGNGDGTFAAQATYATGSGPYSVHTADLDGDGDFDLTTANRNSDSVSVLLGNGDGTFAAQTAYAAGNGPYSVYVADLDGDGDPDLATANELSDNVSVLLGIGDGTFAAQATYTAGDTPISVYAADLDGDGDLDLATANYGSDSISVLLGIGDGTFTAQATYTTGDGPYSVHAADLDGDGDLDLVTANAISDNISVLLGIGDGTFAAQATYTASDYPRSVYAADLDGDGDLDLAAANQSSNNVSVLLGNGDGTFAAQTAYAASNGPYSVYAVDLDGDGDLDLATANNNSDDVSVLLDIYDLPPPTAPTNLTAGPGNGQMNLTWTANSEADLHKYNIYRGTSSPASTLIDSVVASSPPDTFYTDTGLTNGQEYFYRITAVDSAGNESGYSNEDSATPRNATPPSIPPPASSIATDGTVKGYQKISDTAGNFTAILDDGDVLGGSVAGLGDLDGDGINDVAVGAYIDDDGGTDRGAVYVLFMNSDGTVKSYQKISDTAGSFTATLDDVDLFGISMAILGDLDGDGVVDLVVGAHSDDDGGTSRGAVYILFMNSDGTVKSYQKISDTEGNFMAPLEDIDHIGISVAALGDLDGDGVTDLAVGSYQDDDGGTDRGAVYVLFMQTDGTVKSYQKISDTAGNFAAILDDDDEFSRSLAALGDLDGDGVTDLAVGTFHDDDGGTDRGAVYVLFMNTNGTVKSYQKISDTEGNFGAALDDSDRFGVSVAAPGDVDRDGIADMIVGANEENVSGASRGAVYVLFMNSDGTVKSYQKISDAEGGFAAPLADGDNFGFSATALGDLDADGVTDLAVGAYGDDDGGTDRGAVYVLFLQAPPAAPANLTATPGDGQISLLWNANSESDLHKYNLYRDTSSPATTLVDSVVGSPPDTGYNDTGLSNGTRYYYRITAVDNAQNESGYSSEVVVRPGSGLIAYYPFNGNANDESSNANHGTVNGPSLAADKFGNPNSAYDFDGTNDYISIPDNADQRIRPPLSISCWINADGLLNKDILCKGDAAFRHYAMGINPGGELEFGSEGYSQNYIVSATTIDANEWYHIIGIHDNYSLKLYINGQLDSAIATTNSSDPDYNQVLQFGIDASYVSEKYLDGTLDEVRIYDKALTTQEIQALYNDFSKPALPQNLIATPGDGQISLIWDAISEADLHKYRIYRDTASPASILIDSVVASSPPDTFYTDSSLTNGLEYFYRVTAVDSAGNESGYSSEVSETPNPFIVATSPGQNALNVPQDTTIFVTFGRDINPATINDSTFVVHGGYTGRLALR
jgi:fibronectin type 3 domain-containing protein